MELQSSSRDCPDFEDLSCFADGELDAVQVPEVAEHVATCERCAGLMAHLTRGFGSGSLGADTGPGGAGCADEERLILYLMRHLSDGERAVVEKHLGHCDACVYGLSLLHRRLRIQDSVERPVPAQFQERVRAILELETAERNNGHAAAREPTSGWWERVRDSLDRFLRLPVLLPAAVAAGALLVVGVQDGYFGGHGGAPNDLRAIDLTRDLRVTALRAEVRERPSANSALVGEIERGQLLRVAGEERDWYRVELPRGGAGWVAREAFE
jgi:hypothetical protein